MAGHVVRSLTDLLREILVFNNLIIMRGSIHVSERKKNEYKTRQTSGREIPSCRRISTMSSSPVATANRVLRYFIYFMFPISTGFYLWLDTIFS